MTAFTDQFVYSLIFEDIRKIEEGKDESGLSYTKDTKETSPVTSSASSSAAAVMTYTLTQDDI